MYLPIYTYLLSVGREGTLRWYRDQINKAGRKTREKSTVGASLVDRGRLASGIMVSYEVDLGCMWVIILDNTYV